MFANRTEAGQMLARALEQCNLNPKEVVVYSLPRGGVVVGVEVAKALGTPLDLIITRKIGHPNQPEMAIAAVSENADMVLNPEYEDLSKTSWFSKASKDAVAEAKRRRETYLKSKKPVSCSGKTAILVDDGVATGLTMKSAIQEINHFHPSKIIIAVPVAPLEVVRELEVSGVKVISLEIPEDFLGAVGSYYKSFQDVSDREVTERLELTSAS